MVFHLRSISIVVLRLQIFLSNWVLIFFSLFIRSFAKVIWIRTTWCYFVIHFIIIFWIWNFSIFCISPVLFCSHVKQTNKVCIQILNYFFSLLSNNIFSFNVHICSEMVLLLLCRSVYSIYIIQINVHVIIKWTNRNYHQKDDASYQHNHPTFNCHSVCFVGRIRPNEIKRCICVWLSYI